MFRLIILMSTWTLLLLTTTTGSAQVCPLNGATSKKLVCLIPQIYGPFGFGTTRDPTQSVLYTGDFHAAHFGTDFLATFAPINQAVGIQVSQLPIASPSSGSQAIRFGVFELEPRARVRTRAIKEVFHD